MKQKNRSRQATAKHSARLGAYLATGLGASAMATATTDAAIVVINIGPTGFNIGGVNGGGTYGYGYKFDNFPFSSAGELGIANYADFKGLYGRSGLQFAYNGGFIAPSNFALNATIDGSANFSQLPVYTLFQSVSNLSPNFGPGSYMGFKTDTNNFGWLEVTWDNATKNFQILSGAYEGVAGVAILAGATASAAVPEPSTWAMSALLAGGVAFTVWRKRRQKSLKEAA